MTMIAIINGPNLNLLGAREPHHYGNESLESITKNLRDTFKDRVFLDFFQSNHEGMLIDHIQG